MLRAHLRRRPSERGGLRHRVVRIGRRPAAGHRPRRAPRSGQGHRQRPTAIYVGDNVRVAGLKVGTITALDPEGDRAKTTLAVDRDVPVPADAKAIIVAQKSDRGPLCPVDADLSTRRRTHHGRRRGDSY